VAQNWGLGAASSPRRSASRFSPSFSTGCCFAILRQRRHLANSRDVRDRVDRRRDAALDLRCDHTTVSGLQGLATSVAIGHWCTRSIGCSLRPAHRDARPRWLFMERTDYGLIVRAGVRDRTMVQLLAETSGRPRRSCSPSAPRSPDSSAPPPRHLQHRTGHGFAFLVPSFVVVVVGGSQFLGAVLVVS